MRRLWATIILIAGAWAASSLGYSWLLPVLSADNGYNDAPLFYAFYYGLWAAAMLVVFRRSFLDGSSFDHPREYLVRLIAMVAVFSAYALFILPRLPVTEWTHAKSPVDFFSADAWYFVPKSIEILFQQILIAALILALKGLELSLMRISLLVAALFGGFHLTLALSYDNPLYVIRYSVAATLFGLIVPYFILRMRNGFLISYAVHWTYYALDLALIHIAFAAR